MEENHNTELRKKMLEEQIAGRGIKDSRVLAAMEKVPRHLFVPESMRDRAYEDSPLPIGGEQTISQPYMVAWMTDLLHIGKDDRVLEVGTGSGYQAAILCELAAYVYSIEKNPELAAGAEEMLRSLGYKNISIKVGDGTKGWPEEAPFDGIIVTAGAPSVPQPLLDQLAEGGRLIIPVGSKTMQVLTVITREVGKFQAKQEGSCVFVPLVGRFGWQKKRML
ncbi:MAG: protein-L-isoaspartate O-methyltransferase [Candidatus Solincola sediminis]|uniref:Protein-L-isoaspartate O-methyltransferase n=1 Tax=Candidatus Solincola sediminis TaxID=1797199 RepID=A0A1F2WHJ4_9ACTN|nr:MAG: protein-L-isoaspartate O-methyltransferase [Candidatus Solincola sediminis]OFW58769.1 MAG: protein-L-isoaspartate O-methyltransferase [Candidatus Solincola sediminis]